MHVAELWDCLKVPRLNFLESLHAVCPNSTYPSLQSSLAFSENINFKAQTWKKQQNFLNYLLQVEIIICISCTQPLPYIDDTPFTFPLTALLNFYIVFLWPEIQINSFKLHKSIKILFSLFFIICIFYCFSFYILDVHLDFTHHR